MTVDDEPSGTDLAGELRRGRRVRYRVTAMFVVVVLVVGGAMAYYRYEQRHACDVATRVRDHNEDLDIRVFTRLGEALQASPAETEDFLATIRREYDAMPEPASC